MNKVDLKDVTFLLIVKFDTMERLENTVHVVDYLDKFFDTHIVLWEFGSWYNGIVRHLLPNNVIYEFHEDVDPIFHRTHFLNEMIDTVKTEYISVWDVDVVIDKKQIVDAVRHLREGADAVYPYESFYDTTDEIRRMYLSKSGDFSILLKTIAYMNELYGPSPVGGSFFVRADRYIESGKENERFYGWGYEDGDRYYRWTNLGYKIDRIDGPLFHLSHPRGLNSLVPSIESDIVKKRILISTVKEENHE